MVGKDPHRSEGKAGVDGYHRRTHEHDKPLDSIDERGPVGEPSRVPAEEQIGGSRPGVPSRMRGELGVTPTEDDDA